jgi:hypothetical protein
MALAIWPITAMFFDALGHNNNTGQESFFSLAHLVLYAGMTVAALEAIALRNCLGKGRAGLERRFLRAVAKHVDHAWQMAIGSDLALPEVDGERPLRVRVLNSYTDRLLKVAQRDPVVATAFRNVVGMLRPPAYVMRPQVALRVLRG